MNILDSRFKYTPSHATDIRKTFARVRQEQITQKQLDADAAKRGEPQSMWAAIKSGQVRVVK